MNSAEKSISPDQEAYFQQWQAEVPLSAREQKDAATRRLVAAVKEFNAALIVPLSDPDTGQEVLPVRSGLPLSAFVELSRVGIRHTLPQGQRAAALKRLDVAEKEFYAAILAGSEPATGEGATTWPKVPLKSMAALTGLRVHSLRQLIGDHQKQGGEGRKA